MLRPFPSCLGRIAAAGVLAAATAAHAQSGLQTTPERRAVLVNKDLGNERWVISFDLAEQTATGNVFFRDGRDPAFVWCDPAGLTSGELMFTCYGADRCTSSPCLASEWRPLGEPSLPVSFFEPPGTPELIEASTVEALRSAIADAPPRSTIRVRAGTYLVSASIDVPRDDITIEGEGGKTLFILAANADAPVFVLGEPTPATPTLTRRRILLRRLRVNGNRSQQTGELATAPGRGHLRNNCVTVRQADDVVLQDLELANCRSAGAALEQTCRRIELLRIHAIHNEIDGVAWDGEVYNSRLRDSHLVDNGWSGLSMDLGASDNVIERNLIAGNARVGIFLSNADRNLFRDNIIERNGEDGVFILDQTIEPGQASTDNVFAGNHVLFNLRNGIWQAGPASTGNQVTGGRIECNGDLPFVFEPSAPLVIGSDVVVQTPATAPDLCGAEAR